jgi:hypothetical protein
MLQLDSGFFSLIFPLVLQGWEAGGQYSIFHGEGGLAEAH